MAFHVAQVTVECNIHEDPPAVLRGPRPDGPIGPITDKVARVFCAHGISFEGAMTDCLARASEYVKAEAEMIAKARRSE